MCVGCRDCGGNPPLPRGIHTVTTVEVEELLDEIYDIVQWEDAGHTTDWSNYPFEYRRLVREWRRAEKDVRILRDMRFAAYIKSHFKEQ